MKKNNVLYVIGMALSLCVSQASGMVLCMSPIDDRPPVDVAAIGKEIKEIALPDGYSARLNKNWKAFKDYIEERMPSFLHAVSLGTVATVGSGFLTGDFAGITPYLLGTGASFTTYLLSRYFSEPIGVAYYRLAHNAYSDLWKKNKDLLSLQTEEQLTAYIWGKYDGKWPLVTALAAFKFSLKSCQDCLDYIKKSEKHLVSPGPLALPFLSPKCYKLKSLVQDSQKTLSAIFSFVLNHRYYKDQQKAYDAEQTRLQALARP